MKTSSIVQTLLFSCALSACADSAQLDSDAASTQQNLTDACAAAWSSSQVYTGGQTCSLNGVNYTAAFWTQNQSPDTNSGAAGSGMPWVNSGACSSSTTGGTTGGTTTGGTTTGGSGSTGVTTISPALNNGLCLDVSGSSTANGAAVQLYTCNGTKAQNWTFTSGGQLQALGKCLDVVDGVVANGTKLQLWDCNDGDVTQIFAQSGQLIVWTAGNKCLDVAGSNAYSGLREQVWSCNGTNAQNWTTSASSGGSSTSTTTAGTTTGGGGSGSTTGGTTTGGNATGGTGTASGIVFSPYKDVTINTNWNTSVISTKVTGALLPLVQAVPDGAVTWAFATGECGSETWGGLSASTLATANVASWVSAQKPYILSTGGAAGSFTCGSDAGFSAFLDRYNSDYLIGVDFDIEAGQSADVIANLVARVKAAQANSKYSKLRFSFTVATLGGNSPQSLGGMGIAVMSAIKNGGLSNYYVNLMAMDYGSANAGNCSLGSNGLCAMGASAIAAADNLHNYYNVPYAQIELTPMIGGNDTQDEVFTINDAAIVSAFAKASGLGGVHFWSLDRDVDCAPGFASPTCNSYGSAGTLGFTKAFNGAL